MLAIGGIAGLIAAALGSLLWLGYTAWYRPPASDYAGDFTFLVLLPFLLCGVVGAMAAVAIHIASALKQGVPSVAVLRWCIAIPSFVVMALLFLAVGTTQAMAAVVLLLVVSAAVWGIELAPTVRTLFAEPSE